MSMKRTFSAVVVAAALAAPAIADVPQGQTTRDGIRYVSGGIGKGEAAAMREAAPDYGLNLIFATARGDYLANVRVTVKDRSGQEVFSTLTDGPMLLAALPPGSYTVQASANGKTVTREVSVPKNGHRQAILRLPAADSGGAPQAALPHTDGGRI